MPFIRHKLLSAAALSLSAMLAPAAIAAPVLLISIDGLRPGDVLEAEKHGLKVPTLRALAASGMSTTGVRGVLPTITYPSHTTLLTGVHPAKHGISGNVAFDPEGTNMGGWMWYAQDIKVPTLWDTVKAKGGKLASIGWPASVGKREIDYNIPEFWRAGNAEDEKLLRAVSSPDMPQTIERKTGIPFTQVALGNPDMDDARMMWGSAIIAEYKPRLTTIHIVSLDGARHKHGPDSPEARTTLERIDRGLAPMIKKAREAMPDLLVAIVSDHGFLPTGKGLNLIAAFAGEGLVELDPEGKVTGWSAMPWTMGGSAAILLKDRQDKAVAERVRKLLEKLAANPANGINRILDRSAIATQGGTPDAAFWVDMKSGYSSMQSRSPELVQDISGRGAHGYSPEQDELLAAFFLSGPGIEPKRLDVIDMRDIGPTLGELLEAPLAQHDGNIIEVTATSR